MRQYKITIEVGSDEEGTFKPWGHSMTATVYEDAWLAIGSTAEKMAGALDDVIGEWKDKPLTEIVEKEAGQLYNVWVLDASGWTKVMSDVDFDVAGDIADWWRSARGIYAAIRTKNGEKP